MIRRVAGVVLAIGQQFTEHDQGNCIPISAITALTLQHYGIEAAAVAVDFRIQPSAGGIPIESVPDGAFSGHAAVRVRLARTELIVDLTFAQFRCPQRGVEPALSFLGSARPKALDQGWVTWVTRGLNHQGIRSVSYSVRPEHGWNQAVVRSSRRETFGSHSDQWHLENRRKAIDEIVDSVVAILELD